jgi:hypothetical protein
MAGRGGVDGDDDNIDRYSAYSDSW